MVLPQDLPPQAAFLRIFLVREVKPPLHLAVQVDHGSQLESSQSVGQI